MPIHDWTTRYAGTFHNFHQQWIVQLTRMLNGGRLPPGHFAMTDQKVEGWEPDVVTPHIRAASGQTVGGLCVHEHPPKVRKVLRRETEAGGYARRADRIVVKHKEGDVVAIIEIVSPGSKDRPHSVNQFVANVRDFLRKSVHVLFVDLFPHGDHDPHGLHSAVWSVWTDTPDDPPADKPLRAVSYDAGNPFLAYVEPLAVGDPLPEMPLFLAPGIYIPCPLEESYQATWDALPVELRGEAESR